MNNNKINLLFFSTKCQYCHKFVNIMENHNLLNYFRMINVDENLNSIPKTITTVPAILISQTNNLFMGSDAFKWVENMILLKEKNITEMNNKNLSMKKNSGIKGFNADEMLGISDNFTFINFDMALPKSYAPSNSDIGAIITPPKEDNKISTSMQNNRIKELLNNREQQNKQISEIMKKEQIEAVAKYEKNNKLN